MATPPVHSHRQAAPRAQRSFATRVLSADRHAPLLPPVRATAALHTEPRRLSNDVRAFSVVNEQHGSVWSNVDPLKFGALGITAIFAIDVCTYPLATLKTLVQVETTTSPSLLSSVTAAARRTSLRQLYQGFPVYFTGGMPPVALYMATYNVLRTKFVGDDGASGTFGAYPLLGIMAAGMCSDIITLPIYTPAEVIAKRQQIARSGSARDRSVATAVRAVVAETGIRGLWRGNGISMLMYGPASAMYWATYEVTNPAMHRVWHRMRVGEGVVDGGNGYGTRDGDGSRGRVAVGAAGGNAQGGVRGPTYDTPGVHFAAGLLAGSMSAVVTNPLDVLKTRIQTRKTADGAAARPRLAPMLRHIVRTEGAHALWRGLAPRVLSEAPTAALFMLAYEQVLRLSSKDRKADDEPGAWASAGPTD